MSLEQIYRRYRNTVYLTAVRYVEHDDAEDVTHDVFLRLPAVLSSYAGRGSFEGWLRRMAARAALNHLRRVRRRREGPLSDQAPTATFENRLLARWELERAFRRLPSSWLDVVVLKELGGFSHDQIGRRLGIAPGTSKARLHHARVAMRVGLTSGKRP